jgi:hypothetical protein
MHTQQHAPRAGLFGRDFAHQAGAGAVGDPGGGVVGVENFHLELHHAARVGHAAHGIGHTGGQRDGQHVALGAAADRQAGQGGAGR